MEDPFNLQRFADAQAAVYSQVCAELRRGRKTSHWMWFIFPQIQGLGQSPMAIRFAIGSIAEANAYLLHPLLGLRLRECCDLLLKVEGRSIEEIMGYPDDLKLKSSMTLFSQAEGDDQRDNSTFLAVLQKYFKGEPDGATLRLLNR